MNATLPRRVRLLASVAALLAMAVTVVGLTAATDRTSAAWTDVTHYTAAASSGTWTDPDADPVTGCVVYDGVTDQPLPGVPCSITSVRVEDRWTSQWPDGPQQARLSLTLDYQTTWPNYVVFTVNLRDDAINWDGGPLRPWVWNNPVLLGTPDQYLPLQGSTCSELPVLSARTPIGAGPRSRYELQLLEDRNQLPTWATPGCS